MYLDGAPLARIDWSVSDLGNVLRAYKSSSNVHLDWTAYTPNGGAYVVHRKEVVDPDAKTFAGAIAIATLTGATKFYDDAVVGDGKRYDYVMFKRAAEALVYYHTDHLGTPIAMTSASSGLVWKAEYRPFGAVEIEPYSTITNNLRFPGQYFDAETGLHQNWFRDYDPKTGRYREADPIGLAGGSNTYTYVENNPPRWTDPLGLKTMQCTKPLNALMEKFGSRLGNFAHDWIPAAYHQYSCVIDTNGTVTCGGQDFAGSALRSPGKPSEDKLEAGQCKEVEPDNACFEKCLIDAWAKPRPTYGIPFGTDCQEYDEDAISRCRKQYKKQREQH